MPRHVMLDIEVVGVLASIGACEFNQAGDFTTFHRIIDQTSVLMSGVKVNRSTIKFWQSQPKEAIAPLLTTSGKVSLETALNDFKHFVAGNMFLWAKGPDYDCVELIKYYEALDMKVPWLFRNTRDVRTVMALAGVKAFEPEHKHDALSDAIAQAKTVMAAYEKLGLQL